MSSMWRHKVAIGCHFLHLFDESLPAAVDSSTISSLFFTVPTCIAENQVINMVDSIIYMHLDTFFIPDPVRSCPILKSQNQGSSLPFH